MTHINIIIFNALFTKLKRKLTPVNTKLQFQLKGSSLSFKPIDSTVLHATSCSFIAKIGASEAKFSLLFTKTINDWSISAESDSPDEKNLATILKKIKVDSKEVVSYNNPDLTSIPAGVFTGLTKLENLTLCDNPNLFSISANAFAGLTKLKFLDLYDSPKLSSILANAFAGLTKLEFLNLPYSNLTSIPNNTFAGLTGLTKLDLSHSNIFSVEDDAFTKLTSLQTLNLSYSKLSSIPKAFTKLTVLKSLDLSGSPLSSIPKELATLTSLETLNLSHSNITSIEAEAFKGLTNLQHLYLYSNNKLSLIAAGAFAGLKLVKLDLSNSALSTISANAFGGSCPAEEVIDGPQCL